MHPWMQIGARVFTQTPFKTSSYLFVANVSSTWSVQHMYCIEPTRPMNATSALTPIYKHPELVWWRTNTGSSSSLVRSISRCFNDIRTGAWQMWLWWLKKQQLHYINIWDIARNCVIIFCIEIASQWIYAGFQAPVWTMLAFWICYLFIQIIHV